MTMSLRVVEYLEGEVSPFGRWFSALNAPAAGKVATALYRLGHGHRANVKSVGQGVSEYKVDFGPGYRIYFGQEGNTIIILLGGGTKKDRRKVTLSSLGRLTGLDNLSPELQQSIKEFLLAAEVKRPDILGEISGVESALRGTDKKQSFKLLSPVGVVIAEDRPVFEWEPLEGATTYRVEISDSPSRAPTSSEQLSPHVTQWTPAEDLQSGKIYSWVVIATVNGREVVSPPVSLPEARFKVLEEEKARELNRLKRMNSHLALGVFYALEGMAADAEREFQILIDNNSQSSNAQRLLRIVRLWK